MKYLLLVNHHQLFAKALGEAIIKRQPSVAIDVATNANTALKHLSLRPCDMVLVDARLPEVDGFQLLLRIQQRYPYLARAVMASQLSDEQKKKATELGMVLAVDKPSTPADYDPVVESILEVIRKIPEVVRRELDPGDINSAVVQGKGQPQDSTIFIYMGFDRGSMFIEGGRLVHAETQASRGRDALEEILSWHDGLFERRELHEPSRRSLEIPWLEVFAEWKKELKKKPSVNTAVIRREFDSYVSGQHKKPKQQKVHFDEPPAAKDVVPQVVFGDALIKECNVTCSLQLEEDGNLGHQHNCPDAKIMKGIASFTMAKAKELSDMFQWEVPLSVHYLNERMHIAVLPYGKKTVLLGWSTRYKDTLEKINRVFGGDNLDAPASSKPRVPGTIEAMKKFPGLHGYAVFKKPLQLLVKKFSPAWSMEMLESATRVASQMCTILRLQGMPLDIIQLKFKVGSVLARPFGDLMLVVICHSQTKTALLKDCMLRINTEELKSAIV